MSRTDDFRQDYKQVVDSLSLPDRIALVYRPEACLAERESRSVWLLRRRCDEAPYALKIAREGGEDLEEEFRLLTQLYPALAGRVPLAADCFRQEQSVYLVRSYLPGQSLTRYLDRTGPCDEAHCRQLGGQLVELLERLHGMDPPIIHRDIKPDNIIVGSDGGVGLIDFGIARQYKPHRDSDTRIMGSSVTAPPEQYGFAQTDERADLYALGATLIWALTGSYDRGSLEEAPVSRQLKGVLRKCTAFSPDDRYPTAGALKDALGGRSRRGPVTLAAAACALALCLGVAGGAVLPRMQASQPVEFSSYCLELAVREELDRPLGEITYGDLEQVERLALLGNEVLEDPSSYSYYMNDTTGDTSRGDVSDLSLLAHMPNLEEVWLCRQQITELSPLEGLPITTLVVCDNHIEDLSPLSSLIGLSTLWLGGNTPSDLSPLAGLARLRNLNLDGVGGGDQLTPLDSLAPLTDLPLVRLSLGGRTVSDGDWSVLATLPLLEELSLWAPPEEAVAALTKREQLPILNVGLLPCEDLSVLAGCQVVDLRLHAGQNSLEGAGDLPRLRNLGLFSSHVTDLSPLAQAGLLETFCFNGPAVPDFSPLTDLPRLNLVLVPQSMTASAEIACPGRVSSLG
ncbi:MAG: serine/threonine protein kinase [Clostridiales bacterium]|uniref:protein kinase domain-containing protein n=1 Tax=Flavonifractor porci TaxID=3133422 RepID=UPI0030998159|nr:serine/threonine protein kinase [Clostridiales bacterium]